jgi:hypothetical protein
VRDAGNTPCYLWQSFSRHMQRHCQKTWQTGHPTCDFSSVEPLYAMPIGSSKIILSTPWLLYVGAEYTVLHRESYSGEIVTHYA